MVLVLVLVLVPVSLQKVDRVVRWGGRIHFEEAEDLDK